MTDLAWQVRRLRIREFTESMTSTRCRKLPIIQLRSGVTLAVPLFSILQDPALATQYQRMSHGAALNFSEWDNESVTQWFEWFGSRSCKLEHITQYIDVLELSMLYSTRTQPIAVMCRERITREMAGFCKKFLNATGDKAVGLVKTLTRIVSSKYFRHDAELPHVAAEVEEFKNAALSSTHPYPRFFVRWNLLSGVSFPSCPTSIISDPNNRLFYATIRHVAHHNEFEELQQVTATTGEQNNRPVCIIIVPSFSYEFSYVEIHKGKGIKSEETNIVPIFQNAIITDAALPPSSRAQCRKRGRSDSPTSDPIQNQICDTNSGIREVMHILFTESLGADISILCGDVSWKIHSFLVDTQPKVIRVRFIMKDDDDTTDLESETETDTTTTQIIKLPYHMEPDVMNVMVAIVYGEQFDSIAQIQTFRFQQIVQLHNLSRVKLFHSSQDSRVALLRWLQHEMMKRLSANDPEEAAAILESSKSFFLFEQDYSSLVETYVETNLSLPLCMLAKVTNSECRRVFGPYMDIKCQRSKFVGSWSVCQCLEKSSYLDGNVKKEFYHSLRPTCDCDFKRNGFYNSISSYIHGICHVYGENCIITVENASNKASCSDFVHTRTSGCSSTCSCIRFCIFA